MRGFDWSFLIKKTTNRKDNKKHYFLYAGCTNVSFQIVQNRQCKRSIRRFKACIRWYTAKFCHKDRAKMLSYFRKFNAITYK